MTTIVQMNEVTANLHGRLLALRQDFTDDKEKAVTHLDNMREALASRYDEAIAAIDAAIGQPPQEVEYREAAE